MVTQLSADRIVSSRERRELIPYSDMHVWRLEQAGQFPQRIRLGANRVGWSLKELQDWIQSRIAQRDAQETK
jgi:prophage regulatory protein